VTLATLCGMGKRDSRFTGNLFPADTKSRFGWGKNEEIGRGLYGGAEQRERQR